VTGFSIIVASLVLLPPLWGIQVALTSVARAIEALKKEK
jgi:hypothetical protein